MLLCDYLCQLTAEHHTRLGCSLMKYYVFLEFDEIYFSKKMLIPIKTIPLFRNVLKITKKNPTTLYIRFV